MRRIVLSLFVLGATTVCGHADTHEPQPVSVDEAAGWIDYLAPLPKQLDIEAKVTVAADRVAVDVPSAASPQRRASAM